MDWRNHSKLIIGGAVALVVIIVAVVLGVVFLGKFKCSLGEGSSTNKAYQVKAQELHNTLRSDHQAGPLSLNGKLNLIAEECAQFYVTKVGTIDHSCPCKEGNGENLYMMMGVGGGGGGAEEHAVKGTQMWYDEIKDYDFANPIFAMATGHFTAMVWVGCKELGIGYYTQGSLTVVVAIYKPHPNMQGEFRTNVLPKLDKHQDTAILAAGQDSGS